MSDSEAFLRRGSSTGNDDGSHAYGHGRCGYGIRNLVRERQSTTPRAEKRCIEHDSIDSGDRV